MVTWQFTETKNICVYLKSKPDISEEELKEYVQEVYGDKLEIKSLYCVYIKRKEKYSTACVRIFKK